MNIYWCLLSKKILAFSLALLCGAGSIAQAESFHVSSVKGSDSNPGSQSEPFRTIQVGLDALGAGDDLVIESGTYRELLVLDDVAGIPGDFIEIRAAEFGSVVIEALEIDDRRKAAFLIENSDYVRLAGINIQGARHHGIMVLDSRHIELLENRTYNTGQSGIRARHVNDLLLAGNDVSRAVQIQIQESISLSNIDGFVIRNNRVHDRPRAHSLQQKGGVGRGGEGIDVKDGSRHGKVHDNIVDGIEGKFGIYIDAYDVDSFDIEVFNNVVTRSGCGFALSTENGTSASGYLRAVKLYNNLSYGNRCGIYFGNHGGNSAREDQVRRVEDIAIYNNTIYGNGIGTGGGGIDIANPNLRRLTVRNNVIFGNQSSQIRLTAGVPELPHDTVIESNLVHGKQNELPMTNTIDINPDVIDAVGGDFRLNPGSPAIDAGVSEGAPTFDIRGIYRPQGDGIDLGAFEFSQRRDVPTNSGKK